MALERITAPHVQRVLNEHLQKHELKIDPKLHNLHVVIFGDKGDDGLNSEFRELRHCYKDIDERLEKIEKNINWGVVFIIGSFLTSLLRLIWK